MAIDPGFLSKTNLQGFSLLRYFLQHYAELLLCYVIIFIGFGEQDLINNQYTW